MVEANVRHCPDCGRTFAARFDVCPDCWTRLAEGPAPAEDELTLVYESSAFFEADLLESLLRDEGIPYLRVPAPGALPWSLAGVPALTGLRLYVPAPLAPAAAGLIHEVTGDRSPRSGDPAVHAPYRPEPPEDDA